MVAPDAAAAALAAYRAAAALDPRFAPHALDALERGPALGEGGMGQVVVARDRRLGREAALKVIQPDLVDPTAIRRFEREAEVMARLEHPAIPPLYEAGTDARGQRYLLMRRVPGEPLSQVLQRLHRPGGALAARLPDLLDALARVADAVAYAHGEGIVHRDLKPQNVVLGRWGEAVVLDWGLARDVADDAPPHDLALTREGETLGTPGYMPPEQARGDPVGRPADVFALGAILCELLTGRPPVEGATAVNRLLATIDGRVARPRDLRPDAPPELDSLAAAALALDPAARPTAAAFAADLRAFLRGEPLAAHSYGRRERLVRLARRRAGALLLALAVTALLGGAVAVVLEARGARASAEAAARRAAETRDALQRAMDLLADADALVARGAAPEEVLARVDEALAQERTRFVLWGAAGACERAGLLDRARDLLVEAVERAPPGLRELAALHRLALAQDPGARTSVWLDRLVGAAAAAGVRTAASCYAEGIAAAGRQDWAAAERAYDDALALDPSLTWAWVERAAVRCVRGDLSGAEADATRAIALDPRFASAFLTRGTVREMQRRWAAAIEDLDRAVALAPDRPEALHTRANARIGLGDLAAAVEDYDRALALDPGAGRAWRGRGVALAALERLDDASASFTRAIEADPADVDAWRNRAALRDRRGDAAGAREDLDRVLALRPDDALALELRGVARAVAGDLAGAEADWTRALDVDPSRANCWSNRGYARLLRGDPRAALADGDRAVALAPRNPDARYNRAQARLALDDLPGALADLERFLELAPAHAKAPKARAQLERLRAGR
ncbi:MAG: tetratricopeptide repeat protein [Planctomycetes bacterium]|nr:tetratricopeptide repeat protein [Planctomycetota bacterium]